MESDSAHSRSHQRLSEPLSSERVDLVFGHQLNLKRREEEREYRRSSIFATHHCTRFAMDLILIVVVLLLLFGGGGYWARGRYWGPRNPL